MVQLKIYGLKHSIKPMQPLLSQYLHQAICETLGLPKEKFFHRYILLDKSDFIYPDDRTEKYIIIEINMFEGRSVETKKMLIKKIYSLLIAYLNYDANDIEISIIETPKHNWGIRGVCGDELNLTYTVET